MNREILFKAKKINNGEWVEGALFPMDDGTYRIATSCLDDSDPDLLSMVCAYTVNPDTICQYTGLTDENGNRIWENDIVTVPDEEDFCAIKWDTEKAEFVFWMNELELIVADFNFYSCTDVTVIGNIFDNPELLTA